MPSFLAIKALASPESPPWQPSLGPHEINTWGLMLKSGQDALRIILIRSDNALVAACAQPIKKIGFFWLKVVSQSLLQGVLDILGHFSSLNNKKRGPKHMEQPASQKGIGTCPGLSIEVQYTIMAQGAAKLPEVQF